MSQTSPNHFILATIFIIRQCSNTSHVFSPITDFMINIPPTALLCDHINLHKPIYQRSNYTHSSEPNLSCQCKRQLHSNSLFHSTHSRLSKGLPSSHYLSYSFIFNLRCHFCVLSHVKSMFQFQSFIDPD